MGIDQIIQIKTSVIGIKFTKKFNFFHLFSLKQYLSLITDFG